MSGRSPRVLVSECLGSVGTGWVCAEPFTSKREDLLWLGIRLAGGWRGEAELVPVLLAPSQPCGELQGRKSGGKGE